MKKYGGREDKRGARGGRLNSRSLHTKIFKFEIFKFLFLIIFNLGRCPLVFVLLHISFDLRHTHSFLFS